MWIAKVSMAVGMALLSVTITTPASAWDSFGHMLVAHAAYQQLTPATQARVTTLVKLNPKYSEWDGWVPPGTAASEHDAIVFMIAATWADEIKSEADYTTDGSHNGNRPDGSPNPAANEGYSDKLRHKYWHFVDTPFSKDGTPLPPIPTPNAQERIALFRSVLSSSSLGTSTSPYMRRPGSAPLTRRATTGAMASSCPAVAVRLSCTRTGMMRRVWGSRSR
jgi:hypothetical protein